MSRTFEDRFLLPLDSDAEAPNLTSEEVLEFESLRRELGYQMLAGISVTGDGRINDLSVRMLVNQLRRDQVDVRGEAEFAGPYVVGNGGEPHQYRGIALYVRIRDHNGNVQVWFFVGS